MVPQVKDAAWLQWMNQLWGADSPAQDALSSAGFYCLLDEQPDHLLPNSFFSEENENSFLLWKINPNYFFVHDERIPSALAAEIEPIKPFLRGEKIILLQDPALRAWWPYWIGETFSSILECAGSSDQTALQNLTLEQRKILTSAFLLLPSREISRREKQWQNALAYAQQHFAQKGYIPIRGLIPPFLVAALRRYYRFHVRSGHFQLGDSQSTRRYIAHNEPIARYFHRQLTYAISTIAGRTLKPSYVYAGCYQEGAELKKHKDRAQCEYSFTFCLDYSPAPRTKLPAHSS